METAAGRILVVGDAKTLATIRGLTELAGCEIEGCKGELEALRRLRRRGHDVVVTSRWTSVEDDLAFLEAVRTTRPGVRGIVIAPSAEQTEVVEAMRRHAFALFTTPVDEDELGSMIATALNEREWKDGIEMISGLPGWISLRVTARTVSADRLTRFMEEIQASVKDEWRAGLLAAFRELLLNAMEHGAGFDTERTIEVSAVQTQRAIVFHFRDPGRGFSFEELGHAAISNPATDPLLHTTRRDELGLRPGGFGILIARRVADELYNNEAGNQVLLIKHIA